MIHTKALHSDISTPRARAGRGGLALTVAGVVMLVLALAPNATAAPPEGVGGGPPDGVGGGPPEDGPAQGHGTFKVKPGDFNAEPGAPGDQRNVPRLDGCGVRLHLDGFGELTGGVTFELIGPSTDPTFEGDLGELGDSDHRNGHLVRVEVEGQPGYKVFWINPCNSGATEEPDPDRIITVVFVEDEGEDEADEEDEVEIGEPLTVQNPAVPTAEPPAEPPVDAPDAAVLGVEFERTQELPRTGAGTVGLAAAGLLALLLGMHLMAWSRRLAPAHAIARR